MYTFKLLFPSVLCIWLSTTILAQGPLQLVQLDDVTHTVVTSGEWTSASTWGGSVPNYAIAHSFMESMLMIKMKN